jgi:hypothetical protein
LSALLATALGLHWSGGQLLLGLNLLDFGFLNLSNPAKKREWVKPALESEDILTLSLKFVW